MSLDSHDADALEGLEVTEGYLLVRTRVLEVIESRRDSLERQHIEVRGPQGIDYSQGFLAACRMFLELPSILRAEIKE